jgi:two-component system phosphate regulon response regulator PhoB
MDTNAGLALVLLVDDESDMLTIYRTKLEAAGFRVATASDGAQAIQAAMEKHPALILMDMRMPVMNGIEAEMELKENPTTKDIKVVFLTAFSDPNNPEIDREKAKEIGALDFIQKGIGLDELVQKVRGYLAE